MPTPIPNLDAVRLALDSDEDVDIAIFGDSTGDELQEWPALWARDMGSDYSVSLSRWIRSSESYQSQVLSEIGPVRGIWSCSVSGWKPLNFYDFVDDCMPIAPDVVIVSLGHNNMSQPEQMIPQMEILLGMIRYQAGSSDLPIVITLQNPVLNADRQPGEEEVIDALRDWTADQGYPVIDVYSAFQNSELGTSALLKEDGLHPSELGSEVWAQTVVSTLTPWLA